MSVAFMDRHGVDRFSQMLWSDAYATRLGTSRQGFSEFFAGADVEFREHLAQVVLDGARAEEQPRADLWVRLPIGGQAGDLRFLGRQAVAGVGRALARGLAGGEQLTAGALGEGVGPDAREQLVGGAQL